MKAGAAIILTEAEWHARRAAHEARVETWLGPNRERSAAHRKHPVYDFLFEYYHYRPAHLQRWHPGLGVVLGGASAEEYLALPGYERREGGVGVHPARLKPERRQGVAWMRALLQATTQRVPFFGCFGLHEWAMVYRCDAVRHDAWPLRFDMETIAAIVESLPIRCSHFDAFRFFTQPARPLNRLQPVRGTVHELEQRGCLHANMDLYKWAFKLAPFTASELVAEAFALAWEIRETDMRASPYDLRALGFQPIPVETEAGRAEYERRQRDYAESGVPIRARLLAVCEALLED
jgi:hypothetical protein